MRAPFTDDIYALPPMYFTKRQKFNAEVSTVTMAASPWRASGFAVCQSALFYARVDRHCAPA